jgi:putative NADH-flavin reductase
MSLKVAIFGSTGGSGKATLVECLQAGHNVTTLVRSQEKLLKMLDASECPANLSIVQGDIRDLQKIKQVIDGKDVIVCAVGGTISFSNPLRPPPLRQDNMPRCNLNYHHCFI